MVHAWIPVRRTHVPECGDAIPLRTLSVAAPRGATFDP